MLAPLPIRVGDLVSAANTLRQGKLFREAALLYEEQLNNPLQAARCLAEAGLLLEAIERYEKLGRWLEAAELHQRLGNAATAEAAVRRVVSDHLARDDILSAAKLVEERLHAPDEALQLLLGAWPASRQAAACVSAAFERLARLGRHDVASERLAQLGREPIPPRLVLPLLTALRTAARDYPHAPVRHRAADFSRVLIARQLKQIKLPSDDASRLMESLVHLAPQDCLLARDANRYLSDHRSAELRAQPVISRPPAGGQPVVLRRLELPRQIQWLHLRREWHWFFAAGVTPKRLTLVRGIWENEVQSISWDCPAEMVKNGLIFEPTRERGKAVALATVSGPPLAQKPLPAADMFFNQECVAGTPAWLPQAGFPFAFGEESIWSGHVAAGRAVLSCHNKRGTLQSTTDVTDDLLIGAERSHSTRLCLATFANRAAIALGNRLVFTRGIGGLDRVELPGQVVALVPTLPHTRQGIVALLENGAAMLWLGANELIELDRDLAAPMGAFVPGGPLVLVSNRQMLLLDVDARGVRRVTRVELTGQPPVGLSATASPGQFALLTTTGEITVYQVPQ